MHTLTSLGCMLNFYLLSVCFAHYTLALLLVVLVVLKAWKEDFSSLPRPRPRPCHLHKPRSLERPISGLSRGMDRGSGNMPLERSLERPISVLFRVMDRGPGTLPKPRYMQRFCDCWAFFFPKMPSLVWLAYIYVLIDLGYKRDKYYPS